MGKAEADLNSWGWAAGLDLDGWRSGAMIFNVFWALNASGEINFKYTSAKQKLFMYVYKKQKYVYNKEPTTLHNFLYVKRIWPNF